MKLMELGPTFLKWIDDGHFQTGVTLDVADGLMFLCPKCFVENAGPMGTHSIICWKPNVPQTTHPVPGRWNMTGTCFDDLSLVAGSSSVALTDGCMWHGHIKNGEVTNA